MGSVSDSGNATASSSSSSVSPPSVAQAYMSPWQSPVPYLFGGLAAVLCLIMFSLLMLAFSYRRQSDRERQGGTAQTELGIGTIQKQSESGVAESVQAYEQKILVIMAGHEHPTFLATPVCAKCSSLGEGSERVFKKGDDDNHENSQKTDEATSSTPPTENGGAPDSRQHSL